MVVVLSTYLYSCSLPGLKLLLQLHSLLHLHDLPWSLSPGLVPRPIPHSFFPTSCAECLPLDLFWTLLTPQLQPSLKWVFRFLGDYLISLKRKCSFLGSETATGTVFCAAAVALACFGFRHLWFAVTPTRSQMEACMGAARSGRRRCAPAHVSLQPEWRDDVAEVVRAAL